MKPTFSNLTVEDAAVILELAPILDISAAKQLEGGSERKFYLETTHGERRMLRVGNVTDWEYKHMKDGDHTFAHIASAGLPVTRMLSYGHCGGDALYYQLHTWLDGEALHDVVPRLSPSEQYALGMKCGKTARKLHTLPLMEDDDGKWDVWYRNDILKMIQDYAANPVKTRAEDLLIGYLRENISLMDGRPQTFTHGDWDTSNLILLTNGEVGIIDYGITGSDPWCEFWGVGDSPYFCTGQLKGYFDGDPPPEYFPLLALYVTKRVLQWGYDKENVLNTFDDMRNPVPSWYFMRFSCV